MKTDKKPFGHIWRKQLLSHARGEVLEIFVGEGKNFRYYPAGISVTATDSSTKIIEMAKREALANGVNTRFIVSALEDLELPRHHFDTVVSTFSLGSSEEPGSVLNKINDWCKPGGNILLLENGPGSNNLIRWLQLKWEPFFHSRTGSRLNLDLIAILETTLVEVKRIERSIGGVIWLVWATSRFVEKIESILNLSFREAG